MAPVRWTCFGHNHKLTLIKFVGVSLWFKNVFGKRLKKSSSAGAASYPFGLMF